MKKITSIIFSMLTFGLGFGQTSLGAGEVAITGVNSGIEGDSSDAFSFVLLTDVEDGTIINFTDTGWLANGGFYNVSTDGALLSEGMITWTASSSLNCGTEIIITDTGSNNWSVSPAVGTALESDQGFTLSRSGDQIIAFQGTTLVPEFLFALHFANGSNWTDAINTNQSALPTGLTDGINAVHISRDNIVYNYNILGNTNLILEALVNPDEWLGSSSNYQTLGIPGSGVFTCDTTILEEGDVAITGVNTTDSDQFSFILLTDILRGTEINFTDKSWDITGTFILDSSNDPTPEGIVKWTATNDLNCGTEIIITGAGGNIWSATLGEAVESEDGFLFNETGGDQIIAFQSSVWTPQFKYALHFGNSNGWTDAVDNKNSAVPAGLTNGINALAFNKDNCIYNYSVTSNQSLILAATVDPLNWTGDNTIRQTLGISIGSFSCTTPNTCFSTTIWNGSSWSNGDPDMSKHIKISSNYSTSINSLMACSLTVDSGITLTVENGTFLAIQNDAVINGTVMVEHQGNFVQNNSKGTITLGPSGSCVLNKTTPLKQNYYYYTYWSSPVVNETIGNVFPLVGADRRYRFNAQNFLDNVPTDDVDDNNNDWETVVAEDTMIPGVGYAVTAEKSGKFPRQDNISFEGKFNTGDVQIDITFDPTNLGMKWNFIGNPYPSAIDFVAFQLANSAIIDGAAYFWSQATPPSEDAPGNSKLNLNQNDYAVFTIGTGGVAGGGPDTPNGYIASGQGFFIPAINRGTAMFTNAMRMADNTSNNQFFRQSRSKSLNTPNPLENKLWVNLTSDNGVFQQILVGYVDGATNGNDGLSYDAPKVLHPNFAAALYSHIENDNTKYVIQGKDPQTLSPNEVITLGFINTMSSPTLYTFSIDHLQGAFLSSHNIYLKDHTLHTLHNLSESGYSFTSAEGTFNNRFELVFQDKTLFTAQNHLKNNMLHIMQLNNQQVQFKTAKNLNIKTIVIFDVLGRPLYHLKGHSHSETYRLSHLKQTVYIIKTTLSNGAIITKKWLKTSRFKTPS